jgi:hypothetical protein
MKFEYFQLSKIHQTFQIDTQILLKKWQIFETSIPGKKLFYLEE